MVSQSPQLADMPIGHIVNSAPAARTNTRDGSAAQNSSSFETMLPSEQKSLKAGEPAKKAIQSETQDQGKPAELATHEISQDASLLLAAADNKSDLQNQNSASGQLAIPLLLQEAKQIIDAKEAPSGENGFQSAGKAAQQGGESTAPNSLASDLLKASGENALKDDGTSIKGTEKQPAFMPVGSQIAANPKSGSSSGMFETGQTQPLSHTAPAPVATGTSQSDGASQADNSKQTAVAATASRNSQNAAPVSGSNNTEAKPAPDYKASTSALLEKDQQLAEATSPDTLSTRVGKIEEPTSQASIAKPDHDISSEQNGATRGQQQTGEQLPLKEAKANAAQGLATVTAANAQKAETVKEDSSSSAADAPVQQANRQSQTQSGEGLSLARQAIKPAPDTAINDVTGDTDPSSRAASQNIEDGDNPLTASQNRQTRTGTANPQGENSPATLHAPKGEAFSRLMAKIEPFAQSADLMSQTDTSLRTDSSGQLPNETTTIRLTGMEQFARTGQLPPQTSLANSQALATQISKFAKNGETRFEIRLDPAELGKIDVRLTIGSDGQTRAHLFVERSETLDYLMRDARGLERALQQSGVDLERKGLEFSLMDQGSQSDMAGQNQDHDNGQENSESRTFASNDNSPSDDHSARQKQDRISEAYLATDGLNMII